MVCLVSVGLEHPLYTKDVDDKVGLKIFPLLDGSDTGLVSVVKRPTSLLSNREVYIASICTRRTGEGLDYLKHLSMPLNLQPFCIL